MTWTLLHLHPPHMFVAILRKNKKVHLNELSILIQNQCPVALSLQETVKICIKNYIMYNCQLKLIEPLEVEINKRYFHMNK